MDAEALARLFHETYEDLAPKHGWETQQTSRTAWEKVPRANRDLMIATVERVIEVHEELGPKTATAPTPTGHLSFREANGRCAIMGCGVKGGGLLEVTIESVIADGISWERPVILCGKHLASALANCFKLADPKDTSA